MDRCYWRNTTEYPDFCYDKLYWVRPTITPEGMGYTARVWQNTGCVNLNRSSGECEGWGDNSYTALFLHNLTVVRNVTGVNNTELVAAVTYYNKTYDLNVINGETFDLFISRYWDGTYPVERYSTELFAPDPSVTVVPVGTFNPNGF
jgi:hypothetical protein